ncbi:cysteine desulfurase family protein [Alkalicoccobacillus porphyridii]|uniref:Cysteine desulfurase n=1 Tax=Alkalicoccobacillus porphyridii TaxID=2597270 RepID=A0A554A320_9BACI|nr:cysteine desulfurase family protein [Alkalicoccobacillus porphyridii]TSB48065.1 cysteine desulfurase [Alkalicoccobacillus porphyridii]
MIYLDNSATTRPSQEALQTYLSVSERFFGNPSSLHKLGMESEKVLNRARSIMAELLDVESSGIYFTSGGTESNNLAIKGSLRSTLHKKNHLITTAAEHASVYQSFKELEKEGYQVTYLPVDETGKITISDLEKALTKDTVLVSISHVNNETGTIQPIYEIGTLLRKYPQIRFHVDHVQGAGKVPLSIKRAGIDLLTLSAHKFHGLKGSALLYIRPGIHVKSQAHGGEQEGGFRGGTENVAGIAAMAKAYKMECEKASSRMTHLQQLQLKLVEHFSLLDECVVNTPHQESAPHIINVSVPGYKPEVIVQKLAEQEIYISTQSACSSKLNEPSRVLLAMGKGEEVASSALRISLSFDSTQEEIDTFIQVLSTLLPSIKKVVGK